MKNLFVLVCGVLFSIGLCISGLTNPHKVQSFLNVFGNWDPSLLLVMVGAIAIAGIGYYILSKKPKPLFADSFSKPSLTTIDRRLILGAIIFGVGWGISGYCPGPAITNLVTLKTEVIIFVVFLIVGNITALKLKK